MLIEWLRLLLDWFVVAWLNISYVQPLIYSVATGRKAVNLSVRLQTTFRPGIIRIQRRISNHNDVTLIATVQATTVSPTSCILCKQPPHKCRCGLDWRKTFEQCFEDCPSSCVASYHLVSRTGTIFVFG